MDCKHKERIVRKLELINDVDVNYRDSRFIGIPDDKATQYAMSGVVDAINEFSKEIDEYNTNKDVNIYDNPQKALGKALLLLDEAMDLVFTVYDDYGLSLNEALLSMEYARGDIDVVLLDLVTTEGEL